MPCFQPLIAYRSLTRKTANGKCVIAFKRGDVSDAPFEKIRLPCSQCLGCKIARSKQWALRCVHEASLYRHNCFITLTFSDEALNERHTLVKSDFQLFMKRLRKSHAGKERAGTATNQFPIRFFHCGEYGSQMSRPHHHALLFNFDFEDKVLWSNRKGVSLYRSEALEKLWTFGFSTIGEVTYQSAAYCARYIIKKINGINAASHYYRVDEETGEAFFLEPEYITMSLRPGIGKGWFDRFSGDVYPKDFITFGGRKFKTPTFYDNVYDRVEPTKMAQVKQKRRLAAVAAAEANTLRKLKARAVVAEQGNKLLKREYEDGSQDVQHI